MQRGACLVLRGGPAGALRCPTVSVFGCLQHLFSNILVRTVRSTLTLLTSVVMSGCLISDCLCFGSPGTVLRQQHNLALVYAKGSWVLQGRTEAVRLLKLACDQGHHQGHPPARDVLGKLTVLFPVHPGPDCGPRCRRPLQRQAWYRRPADQAAAGRIAVVIDGQTKIASLSWANLSTGSGSTKL